MDIASAAEQLKLLTDPSSYQSAENITLAFNVFVGIIGKNVPFKGKVCWFCMFFVGFLQEKKLRPDFNLLMEIGLFSSVIG